jgi:hypothetical protein
MACNEWRDRLLDKLYGELEGQAQLELERHLTTCHPCRQELAALDLTRQTLAEGAPAVPEPPRVLLLDHPGGADSGSSWWRRPGGFRMFAAGFAAATVLLAAGIAAGIAWSAGNGLSTGTPPDLTAEIDLVDRLQLDEALDARDARIMNMIDQRSGQVQTSLAEFGSAIEARRKEDLRLVLGELITTEMWTGKAIHENRESLRHLTLAGQPGVTQW